MGIIMGQSFNDEYEMNIMIFQTHTKNENHDGGKSCFVLVCDFVELTKVSFSLICHYLVKETNTK